MKFELVIPTFNPGPVWQECVDAVIGQDQKPDLILVIDSESKDRTVEIAREAGFCVIQIQRESFNHGGTRQKAIEDQNECDFVVYLTQDAILADRQALKHLLQHFHDDSTAAVCGRQLPKKGAGAIESHARIFNYPERSFMRSIKDVEWYGLKTAFLSNSFAAYRISALREVGGFPKDVIFGEDMYVAAKALKAGYKIAYAADACVYHSHKYTVTQEFKRYFDMGVFHAREPWLRREFGTAEGEGVKFVVSEIRFLMRHSFWRIPEGILRTVMRYVGFRLGLAERFLPSNLKALMSMSPGYFIDSKYSV